MFGLPEKQLSFLLYAGCDTLITPLNLVRWNTIVSPQCALCHSSQPTFNHSWRRITILQAYAGLLGYHASVSPLNTIPPHLSSLLSKPGLILISNDTIILLFELSVVTNVEHHLSVANSKN